MGALLDYLRAELRQARNNLNNAIEERRGYREKAQQIRALAREMQGAKNEIRSLKSEVKDFGDQSFDRFKGNLYDSEYKPLIDDIVAQYDTVISDIDTNVDELNRKASEYDDKAFNLGGLIGGLQSSISWLTTEIQNALN